MDATYSHFDIQLSLLLDSWLTLPLLCYSNRPAALSQKLLALIFLAKLYRETLREENRPEQIESENN